MHVWGRTPTAAAITVALLASPGRLSAQVVPGGDGLPWLWILIALLGLATVVAGLVVWRRQEAEEADAADVPPLLFPAAPATRQPPRRRPLAAPASGPGWAGEPANAPAARVTTPFAAAHAGGPRGVHATPAPATGVPTSASPAWPGHRAEPEPAATAAAAADSLVDGKTIRFHKPIDGTLQILPGRLDVVEGADTGHSIRFIRVSGEPEVTFGRSDGPPYQHIQLLARTVSRKHARMRFENASWTIHNLSQTNPVIVNGEELGPGAEPRVLREGDRIEMGEVSFVFRER